MVNYTLGMQLSRRKGLNWCLQLYVNVKLVLHFPILFNSPDVAYTVKVYICPNTNVQGADVQLLTPIETPVAGFGPVAVHQ